MTCFKPFRALRPRADLAQLALCPPYDVVTRREAEEIAAKSPFSFMHVIRAEADLPGENPYSEAVYRRGAANLKKLEKELEQLNKEKEDIENQFQNLMSPSEIVRKQKELAVIVQKLEESESLWLELSEKLESIS